MNESVEYGSLVGWLIVAATCWISGICVGRMSQWETIINATADIIMRMAANSDGKIEDHHAIAEVAQTLGMKRSRARWFVSFAMTRYPGVRASIDAPNWPDVEG